MKNTHQRAFYKHVQAKDDLLAKLDKISLDRLVTRPPSGAWSSQEVLHHLYLSESGTLHVLKKQLAKDPSSFKTTSLPFLLRSKVLNASLLSNAKYKAPAVVSKLENLKPYEALKSEWVAFKNGMDLLLADVPNAFDKKLVFRHPVAGWLTLKGTLEFLRYHHIHHARQIVQRAGLL